MLKRSGEPCRYYVPGFAGRLTGSEHKLYLEALNAVKGQLLELRDFSKQLDEIAQRRSRGGATKEFPGNGWDTILSTQKPAASWKVVSRILKLELGSILLCSRQEGDGQDHAIIQKFPPQSLYAKANGAVVVLARGNDPAVLVQEYVERTRHTLRFMASDAVARAQEVAWKNSGGQDASRVVKALSNQFSEAVAEKRRVNHNRSISAAGDHRNGVGFSRRL